MRYWNPLSSLSNGLDLLRLQQYLPLAVLKRYTIDKGVIIEFYIVATVLTACGIETQSTMHTYRNNFQRLQQYLPLAVLKLMFAKIALTCFFIVATVLTACGIETRGELMEQTDIKLQQYLPLAVLKQYKVLWLELDTDISCNSTYRLRYWNSRIDDSSILESVFGCNSTYRLRYWNFTL